MGEIRKAVGVAGFNRPHYFRPTIRSVLANPSLPEWDLWFFFDGGAHSDQREYRRIADEELAAAIFRPQNVYFVERSANLGCGVNLIDARRKLFDLAEYDRVFMFEDDMVVSTHYLSLAERMLDWAASRYSDIGVTQPYCACRMSPDEKVCRLDEVDVANAHWWGYLMPRGTWYAIRDIVYEYEDRFLKGRSYAARRHSLIRRWALTLLNQKLGLVSTPGDIFRGPFRYPRNWDYLRYFDTSFATGQDSMTVLAMTLAGLQKMVTRVNRGKPIGVKGIHSTPQHFRKTHLSEVKLENFPSDGSRHAFREAGEREPLLKPWMRFDEIEAIRLLLHERRPRRVLEFGAGGSTVTFARDPAVGEWWSIEHSEEWVRRVLAVLNPVESEKVKLLSRPASSVLQTLSQLLAVGFDMFFVDGFDRCAILQYLRRYLETHPGFVVLHDSSRADYREAVRCFPKIRTLTPGNGKHQGLMLLEV